MTKTFEASLRLRKLAGWWAFIFSPSVVVGAAVGFYVQGTRGALWGAMLAVVVGAVIVYLVYRNISRAGIVVKTDQTAISLRYIGVDKSLLWDDVNRVALTRSIFWRHLIKLEGDDTVIILNLNLQPRWEELVSELAQHISGDKLKNFGWEDVQL